MEELTVKLRTPVVLEEGESESVIDELVIRPPKLRDLQGLPMVDPDFDWLMTILRRCGRQPRKVIEELSAQDSYRVAQEITRAFFPDLSAMTSSSAPES